MHRQSGSPYSPSLQSDAVAAEANTLKNFARNSTYPLFLGMLMILSCRCQALTRQFRLLLIPSHVTR